MRYLNSKFVSMVFVTSLIVCLSHSSAQAGETGSTRGGNLTAAASASSAVLYTKVAEQSADPVVADRQRTVGTQIVEYVADGLPLSKSTRLKFNVSPTQLGMTVTSTW